mmetsp:Transcript_3600/g.3047  ORF Transcript_3600/g.3047 Transcript_3600/m.3047 type:complete len:242 (-) Transcript_3600:178-903(-)|eukprot:CAMPEP_0205808380 /NCGR_PEP_ID=MMETSP0205-20121125/12323_1 /ASSEMBLY_ACC=CAM_ASM_000278 /TAXON_ID=36767 /ORGANISM="Euplotes focardii, Strain TN1" /LENGTH=241 /DNA_ID=CAMNT_0053083979 /DNA_START=33 /DNA_END=758 /DNA_ORIENTATION=+
MDIDSNNSRIVVDEEVGSGGSYNINGHNNVMKLQGVSCEKIVVMGHNNTICGTDEFEKLEKLVVLGHNNIVKNLMINRIEVLGHNNNFKYLYVHKQPLNNGFNNKFSNVGVMEQGSDEGERAAHEASVNQNFDTSSSSSSNSDSDSDEEGYTTTHNFTFSTDNFNFGDMLRDVNLIQNLDNLEEVESLSDEEEDYYEQQSYEDAQEEEKDEEADISPEERLNIINAINSFQYASKKKDEDN